MKESKNRNKNIIKEHMRSNSVITESQESKSIHAAKRLVMQRLSYNEDEADKFIRITLRGKLDALKDPQCGKFTLGVARMYCDGELNDASTVSNLNATLELVASDKHINEFDRNLNGIPCDELIQMFSNEMSEVLDADKKKVNSMKFTNKSEYDIVRIDSFDQAAEYKEYTDWCVTENEEAFDEYTNYDIRQFYFCLKHGFENVPKEIGEGCPLDEYGLSMIAVLVNENGSLAKCTCRWNHEHEADDYIMDATQISEVMGVNFYETFKPNGIWLEALSNAMDKLANGADPRNVFDSCDDFKEGFAVVGLQGKWNFLKTDGKLLSDTWFDECYDFEDGLAVVELDGKQNFITTDGKFISNNWFDYCDDFEDGLARVYFDLQWYYIDRNGVIKEGPLEEGKALNKNVILTEEQFDIFRGLILEGGDSRLKPIKNIIRTAFEGTALNPDAYVTSAEYQVPNKGEQTTWMHYLIYSLRHDFELMGNSDVPMLRNVAKIAFLELNFEKENQDLPKLNVFKKIINLIKNDDNAKDEFIQSNDVTFNALYGRYADVLKQMDDEQKNAVNSKSYERNSRYEIIPIDDFKTAREFGKYTGIDGEGRLCYTEGRQTWDRFTRGGSGQCYLCYMPNYKEIYPRKGENYPKDEYGLSMIWLFVDENGRLSNSNVRWNHGDGNYGNVDTIFTESEISDIVGVNFYETFKPNGVWEEMLSDAMGRLAYGMSPKIAFDECGDFEEGLARIRLNAKWNYLTIDGKILSDIWFDDCNDFDEGLAVVRLNGKWNFITTDGKFISNTWFNYCGYFDEGLAVVRLNGKWNFLTIDGKFLSDTWFDYCKSFRNGLASVQLDGKSNFISAKGEILSDTWFDYCSNFYDGFSKVELNRKWNFLTTGGKILSDTWFNRCGYFEEGFAYIKLNDKWNFLTIDGKFLSDTWFDHCYDFENGFAIVEMNGKRYAIDRNGVIKEEPLEEGKSTNKNVILTEEQFDIFRKQMLIAESQESKSIHAAKKLVMQRLGYDADRADEFIRVDLRDGLPALKTPQGGKFILGVTRMFCDNELNDAATVSSLNATLRLVSSDKHINEFDRNLNGISCNELIQMFSNEMSEILDADKEELNSMEFANKSDYDIVRIDSFDEAAEYNEYTSWCVADREDAFDDYTNNGYKQFYFCLKHGFESVPKETGEGCPLDEYGLSMLAVLVNENGSLASCTCRWNHDNGGDDNVMDTKQISEAVGVNFYETFKPNNKWEDALSYVKYLLVVDGADPKDVFDECRDFEEGFACVRLSDKWNFLTTDKKFLSDIWFDDCNDFEDGLAIVELNNKWNFITTDGKFMSNTWFDDCGYFEEGLAAVKLNGKWNFITTDGKFLSDTWFEYCKSFRNGLASVHLDNKSNFITTDGKFLSDTWFDACNNFYDGFAHVKLNGKWNFLTTDGKILSDTWFNRCGYFEEDFACVELNGKWNFITTDGKILSKTWFENADDFQDGFADVKLNGKWHKIDRNGVIKDYSIGESKTTNKNVILTERQFDIFRGIILEGGDSRLKPIKNIIRAAFEGTALNPDAYVTSAEYQVPNRGEQTTWMHYLIYSLRHSFELMDNGDVPMLKNVAKIAFLELNFEKENQDIEKLNILKKIINLIKNDDKAKVDFIQNKDMTFNTLYEQYADVLKQMDDEQRNVVNSKTYERNSRYNIIPIDDFDTAQEFGKYTGNNGKGRLCYTEGEQTWDNFTSYGINQCYLCCTNNYKEIPPQKGEGYPKDEYGLSMIWLFVDENGRLSNSNVRWNHGDHSYSNVDNIFTESEISDIVGVNFYETFKPNNKWEETLSDAMERLANGEGPETVFDQFYDSEEGFAIVGLNSKWNFITTNGKLLSDTWFDNCYDFKNDFARVELNNKRNFLSADGKILSDIWFDKCYDFRNGIASVELNNKENFVTTDGKLLSDTWFDICYNFENGFACVELNDKFNFVNTDGRLLSDTWFDNCSNFKNGFARVELKGRYNFLTMEGKILFNVWFDFCYDFENGFTRAKLSGEWYKISKNGVVIKEDTLGEGKCNRKTALINKSDLSRIIKESVRLALKKH